MITVKSNRLQVIMITDYNYPISGLNPPANGKIQGLFKAFEHFFKYFSRQILFSRTFQDSTVYSSTFQACANPVYSVNVIKCLSLFSFRSQIKYLLSRLEFTNC